MSKYNVSYSKSSTGLVRGVITNIDNEEVLPKISIFLGFISGLQSLDRYIKIVKEYEFNANDEEYQIESQNLINDWFIEGVSGKPRILNFIDPRDEQEEISQADLIDILEQWKKILEDRKKANI